MNLHRCVDFTVLLFRYIAAIIAAFFASITIFMLAVVIFASDWIISMTRDLEWLIFPGVVTICVGIGVTVASEIIQNASRHISCWIFLALGISFYFYNWYTTVYVTALSRGQEIPWPWMFPWLALGGGLACLFFALKRSNTNKAERADAANSHAFGTSGISAAEQPRMPEASGDT